MYSATGEMGRWGALLRDRFSRAATAVWLRPADRIGSNARLIGRPHIENRGALRIGDDFRLSSQPARSHVVVMAGGSVVVGDRVFISYGAAISSQIEVIIDDDARLGPFTVVMDSDFHVSGDRNAMAQPAPVRIGKRVRIGSRVTILRGSDIGDDASVESGSVVSGVVEAAARVAGVPARAIADRSRDDVGDLPGLVMRVLGLATVPSLAAGPADIPQWDSLGSLKVLLALEETFGVSLAEDDLASARSIGRLAEIVDAARRRA